MVKETGEELEAEHQTFVQYIVIILMFIRLCCTILICSIRTFVPNYRSQALVPPVEILLWMPTYGSNQAITAWSSDSEIVTLSGRGSGWQSSHPLLRHVRLVGVTIIHQLMHQRGM